MQPGLSRLSETPTDATLGESIDSQFLPVTAELVRTFTLDRDDNACLPEASDFSLRQRRASGG